MIWSLLIIFIIAFLILTNTKIEHLKARNKSKKIIAEVGEYRKEKGPMRNDFTLLNYPYVWIEVKNDEYKLFKLNYANNGTKPFYIGEKIPVFWQNDLLIYWDVYDKGIYKYLPKSWKILS